MDLQAITWWRPIVGSSRRMFTLLSEFRLRRSNAQLDSAPCARIEGRDSTRWPRRVDLEYFDSEIRIAMLYVYMRRNFADSRNCTPRASDICEVLATWVHANGGNAGLEQRVERLRWHLAVLRAEDGPRMEQTDKD
jgi:hypothetical protein